MISIHTILNQKLLLGEGIVWDTRSSAFWFVDIQGQKVFRHTPRDDTTLSWNMPQKIGWLIPEFGSNTWIGGLQEGFARLGFGDEVSIDWIARPFQDRFFMRMNDAKADCLGNVWAGSMNNDNESRRDGELFRLSPNGELTVYDTGYCVSNGPAISPDSQLFLHTDSAKRTIYSFDFDKENGSLSGKRIWRIFPDDEGFPDGMNFDVEGNVWVAHWGAGLVSCFSANGQLLQRVKFPVSNITNLSFGGESLDRLFVTTARVGLSASQLEKEPLAGAIFEIYGHGTQGLPTYAFGANDTNLPSIMKNSG